MLIKLFIQLGISALIIATFAWLMWYKVMPFLIKRFGNAKVHELNLEAELKKQEKKITNIRKNRSL